MRFRHLIAIALLVLGSGVVLNAQGHVSELDELVREALDSNREVLAAQKRYEASRQRPTQESSLPDPIFSLGYNSNGKPWPGAGLGVAPSSNIGLMVSQEIPLPVKLKLRGGIASKEAEAEFQQYESIELNVISRLKQAYYRRCYTYATADVLARSRDLLTKLLKITESRYSVGKAAQQDVFKAQTQISLVETRIIKLEQERNGREAEMNSLLKRPAETPLPRPQELTLQPFTLSLNEIYASVRTSSPMLLRDQKMIERNELAVNLARKGYYPDYAITAGYFNQGAMAPMYMARADIKIPIYYWRKQRAGVAEQADNVSQARRNYGATDQNLRFRLKEDFVIAQASWKLTKLYSDTVVPQASLAFESSLSTYETGTVDFLSVITNFRIILEYEINYYDELTSYYMALSRLEEATAQKLNH